VQLSLNPASAEKLTPLFSLSLKVIMEMVRLANIVPGIFRKALQDVEIKGTHQEYHPAHAAGISCSRIRKCYLQQIALELSIVLCFCGVGTGYTIPAGWGIMVCPPAVHLNPDIYEDPLAFNPWRWQVGLLRYSQQPLVCSASFMSALGFWVTGRSACLGRQRLCCLVLSRE